MRKKWAALVTAVITCLWVGVALGQRGPQSALSCQRLFSLKATQQQPISASFYRDLSRELRGDYVFRTEGTLRVRLSPVSRLRQTKQKTLQTLRRWVRSKTPTPLRKAHQSARALWDKDLFRDLTLSERQIITQALFHLEKYPELAPQIQTIALRLNRPTLTREMRSLIEKPVQERWLSYMTSITKLTRWGAGPVSTLRPSLVAALGSTIRGGLHSLTWLLNPTPWDWNPAATRTHKIYGKIKRAKDLPLAQILTEKEMVYLTEKDLLNDALLFQELQLSNTSRRRAGRAAGRLANLTFSKGPLIATTLLVGSLAWPGQAVDKATYISETFHSQGPRVEVILDASPVSHTAIRIGNRVYSPSQATLNVVPVESYMRSLPVSRIVQTIPLKLSETQIRGLETNFSKHLWHLYNNQTGFYDCTTVVSDALRAETGIDIPAIVDASPTLMLAWLKSLNVLGSNEVGPTRMVYDSSQSEMSWKLPVRAMAQSVEAKLFYLLAPVVSATQESIRSEGELFSTNREYEGLVNQRIEAHYENLTQMPEVSSLIRLTRVLKREGGKKYELAQAELNEWLVELQAERITDWDRNYDPALLIEHQAAMAAIEKLVSEIK